MAARLALMNHLRLFLALLESWDVLSKLHSAVQELYPQGIWSLLSPLSCVPHFNVTLTEVKVEPQLMNRLAVLIVFGGTQNLCSYKNNVPRLAH